MFKKLVPFNTIKHAGKKIAPTSSFKFAEKSYIASVMIHEFNRAASIYPIVFLKDGEEFKLYALLGLQQEENLFIDDQGRWNASYIPAIIRRYPFALGKNEANDNELMVCIDEESESISDKEGQDLVGEDGKPGEIVIKAKEFLSELQKFHNITTAFCRELAKRELLDSLNVELKATNGETQRIAGCFAVNEKKFNEISDEDFIALRKLGYLPAIYAHMLSLAQIERLVRLRAEKTKG